MKPTCSTSTTHGPAVARGLCRACYDAQRRGQTPGVRLRSKPGEGAELHLRLPATMLADVERIAQARGESVSDCVREAVSEWTWAHRRKS